jgi:hypothetical protein
VKLMPDWMARGEAEPGSLEADRRAAIDAYLDELCDEARGTLATPRDEGPLIRFDCLPCFVGWDDEDRAAWRRKTTRGRLRGNRN